MIVSLDSPGNPNEIRSALEGSDNELKVEMLKKAIAMSLSGEVIPGLFICMIRYVLPCENHTVQRLLLLYLVRAYRQAGVVDPAAGLKPHWCWHKLWCIFLILCFRVRCLSIGT
jgi:hypothetical protein